MKSAVHKLTNNFSAFFKNINPSQTYIKEASSAYTNISSLIENKEDPAGDLRIKCFLQGSYKRATAIHSINDVDVVALCNLSYKESATQNTRNQIFNMISDSIEVDKKYRDKITYTDQSICIKVILKNVKLEILPALKKKGKSYNYEPFYIFRPDENENVPGQWSTAFARLHQELLTKKNENTDGLFIPMIKIFKHMRFIDTQISKKDAVSFHLECLLYSVKNSVYQGSICECIEKVLKSISGFSPEKASSSKLKTPCRDNILISQDEWKLQSYSKFHQAAKRWFKCALNANIKKDKEKAILLWKKLLGDNYFPANPTNLNNS